MDKKALLDELQRLPAQERVDIAYTLLDGVPYDEAPPLVSGAQMRELTARLMHHRQNPDEPAVTLDQIRRKLIAG